jgi:hypothetical protein
MMQSSKQKPRLFEKRHRPQKSMPNASSITRENSTIKRSFSLIAATVSGKKSTTADVKTKVIEVQKESCNNWPNSEGVRAPLPFIFPLIIPSVLSKTDA